MLDHELGIEEFSEGSEDRVEFTSTIDDGQVVLEDGQVQDAYMHAASALLTGSTQSAYTRADLGLCTDLVQQASAAVRPAKATEKATPEKRRRDQADGDLDDDESSGSDDDGATPMGKSLLGRASSSAASAKKKTRGSKAGGKDKDAEKDEGRSGNKGLTLEKCAKSAEEIVQRSETFKKKFTTSDAGDAESVDLLSSECSKIVAESRAVNVQVLVRGGKIELASAYNMHLGTLKAMVSYAKAYNVWMKARLEGRTTKQPKETKRCAPSDTFTKECAELMKVLGPAVSEPVWGKAAKISMLLDSALSKDDFPLACEIVTTERIGKEMGSGALAGTTRIDGWTSDILIACLKPRDGAVVATAINTVVKSLRSDLYSLSPHMTENMDLLETMANPAGNTTQRLKEVVSTINDKRSGKHAFLDARCGSAWMQSFNESSGRRIESHRQGGGVRGYLQDAGGDVFQFGNPDFAAWC